MFRLFRSSKAAINFVLTASCLFLAAERRALLPRLSSRKYGLESNEGVKEVHLIGQNVNSYRPHDDEFLKAYPGHAVFKSASGSAATGIERIKFTTSFPRDFHPDIVDAIDENDNLCNWVHLPVNPEVTVFCKQCGAVTLSKAI